MEFKGWIEIKDINILIKILYYAEEFLEILSSKENKNEFSRIDAEIYLKEVKRLIEFFTFHPEREKINSGYFFNSKNLKKLMKLYKKKKEVEQEIEKIKNSCLEK